MLTTDGKPMKAGARSMVGPDRECLDSWKQIAVYLHREVRTVRRREKRDGLPVHRQVHVKGVTVWAFKHEIDAWFKNRCQALSKSAARVSLLEHSADWSSPTLLVARQTRNGSGLWLVVAANSHGRNSDSGTATIDAKVDVRKDLTIERNSVSRLAHGNS